MGEKIRKLITFSLLVGLLMTALKSPLTIYAQEDVKTAEENIEVSEIKVVKTIENENIHGLYTENADVLQVEFENKNNIPVSVKFRVPRVITWVKEDDYGDTDEDIEETEGLSLFLTQEDVAVGEFFEGRKLYFAPFEKKTLQFTVEHVENDDRIVKSIEYGVTFQMTVLTREDLDKLPLIGGADDFSVTMDDDKQMNLLTSHVDRFLTEVTAYFWEGDSTEYTTITYKYLKPKEEGVEPSNGYSSKILKPINYYEYYIDKEKEAGNLDEEDADVEEEEESE